MDIDVKILNNMLLNRFQQSIRNIIHLDNLRFIPNMQRWFNLRKLLNVIYLFAAEKTNPVIITDAQKA